MKTRTLLSDIIFILVILFVSGIGFISCVISRETTINNTTIKTEPLLANSKDLQNTVITSNFNETISYNTNYVFTCGFNLAWNELIELLAGELVKLQNNTPLVKYLNQQEFTNDVLSEDAYLAEAAFVGPNTIATLNEKLRAKFKNPPTIEEAGKDLLVFSYFEKDLKFEIPFGGDLNLCFFGNGDCNIVKAFGFATASGAQKYKNQALIRFLSFEEEEYEYEVILSLVTKKPDDELILALVKPENTLRETYTKVKDLIETNNPDFSLSDVEALKIPKVTFQITHDYDELIGQQLLNIESEPYFITAAYQEIDFRLDEYGATARVKSQMSMERSIPFELIFNRPFMLIMKQKYSDLPYIVIWIGNPEILIKTQR